MPYSLAVGDEAGDLGFQFGRGSSVHFVTCLVMLNEAEGFRRFVEDYRQQFHLTDAPEFGFHSSSDRNRTAFLSGLMRFDVAIRAVVLDKRTLLTSFRGRALELYAQYWTESLKWAVEAGVLQNAQVVLDEYGDNPAQTIPAITRRLRQELWPLHKSLRTVQAVRSQSDDLLQAADMTTGAVFRLVEKGDARFHRLIRTKLLIWRWGENENPPR